MEPMVQKKVSDRRHLSQFGFLSRSVFIMKDRTNTWTDDNDNNDNHENNENILWKDQNYYEYKNNDNDDHYNGNNLDDDNDYNEKDNYCKED